MEKVNRRTLLQMGLGAGAGLALWELYRLSSGSDSPATAAPLVALKEVGLDDARLARLIEIALEKGGGYADVFIEYTVSNRMNFDGERVENAGVNVSGGAAIRVLAGDRTVLCATEDISWDSLRQKARDAAATVGAGSGAKAMPLRSLQAPNLYAVASPATLKPFTEKQEFILQAIRAAQQADSRVQTVRGDLVDTLRFTTIATSTGVIAHDRQPSLKVNLTAMVNNENVEGPKIGMGVFSGGGHYGMEYFEENTPERLGRRAVEIALHQLEGVEAPSGELPVVLGSAYSGVLLHEAVGHGLEADFNVRDHSTYAGRTGQVVASPLCTIFDDGHIPNLNGSINFDDEGVPSSSTLLIDRGRLVSYMHSRETALKMGVSPTGNGRRQDFSYPPTPRMTNTYLQGGDATSEDIISSVRFGIYARTFLGGSVDPATGDFTFVPTEAYLIESGRVTTPLASVVLLGNGPEVLKRVSMVGNDMKISDNLWECGKQGQKVPVTVGTPTIKVDKMTVGGSWRK